MSLAAETRCAVENHPFLVTALRAGVVNYTAAARFLEVDGETDAIATALRRYAEELPGYETESRDVRVRMQSGVGPVDPDADDALVTVGETAFGPIDGDRTAIVATGAVDTAALSATLRQLSLEEITPTAAAVGGESLLVVVDRREGATALRTVEDALEAVPNDEE
ncbi:hypothetical protein RBH26_17540 [Natronolimnohabitans sp. A-GB9]|uniref:DUF7523 family protein n=1 Tax=Natronolimnohabitans sp. A-GB9 TaxID=3069757 RepID=UPI0027ADED01|nr:hypothetical protein [Natronolimnohabitans sp. A-GB9]MDQ2052279.1 hypothetical protein [Natronolimnohabitans sp. A-GB9]